MRQIFLFILVFGSVCCAGAQTTVPSPVSERFPIITAALDAGFYSLSEEHARAALLKEPSDRDHRTLTLFLAHSLWGQKRYAEVVDLLAAEDYAPCMAYWRARAFFDLGQYDRALEALQAAEEEPKDASYAPAVMRLRGRVEQELERFEEAERSYQQFAEAYPAHSDMLDNMFDLADVYMAQGKYDEARALYAALLEVPDDTGSMLARLKLAHVLYTTGSAEDVAAARTLLKALVAEESVRLAYRIDACVELAALEEDAGRVAESIEALRKGIALAPDARLRVSLKLALARMHERAGDVSSALLLLEECRAEAPNERVAAELQLEKAGALLQAERFAEAEEAYQIYLNVADDSDGLSRAYMGKGLALWGLQRYAASAVFFDKAEQALADQTEKAQALIKAGDAYFQAGQLEESESRYRTFTVTYSGSEHMANVLYQLGLVLAKIGRRTDAQSTFEGVEVNYPESPFAEKSAMRAADIMRAGGQWEEALQKYTQISQTYTNSADAVLAQHRRGLVLYRLGRYADAQSVFEYELSAHPESEHAPQAFYMRGFCLYFLGHFDEAVQTSRQFVDQYPDSMWTPEVIFWLAELYFNQASYGESAELFMRVATNFPSHELAPRALYWAGRTASAESDYVGAIERYSDVAKHYPGSDVLPQTRFAQGDALTELGQFGKAIRAFEEIIRKYPESELVNAAWGRKGDCQFSLAVDNPALYEEAMNSYQAILDRPSAPSALRLQAEYWIGRCFEKRSMFDKAFSRYMNVVYTFRTVERTPRSVVWFTRSAFAAAALKENEQAWIDAVQVYELVVEADVAAGADARKRIEKIKNANWRLFQ
jgi:TolA-binding protein